MPALPGGAAMDVSKLADSLSLDHALDYRLFEIAGTSITLATLIIFALIIVVTLVVSWTVQRAMMRLFRVRGVRDEGTLGVARRLVHYLTLIIGLGVGLQTIGINLAALFAAGAIVAVGLGFAMQNLSQNFVSGVILLLERSIKPGDVLQVEGRFVKVTRMAMRATHARTLDDEEIIVPNSAIVQSTVTNYTLRDSFYRLRCTVGVVYSSDMTLVRRTLERVADSMEWRAKEKQPIVLLTDFGNSSVDWEVSVWIDDPWSVRRRRSDLNEAIWWALKEMGIVIAFPQLDVHFDPPVVEALEARKAS
jgi:small-conductance mechanosensitive channel